MNRLLLAFAALCGLSVAADAGPLRNFREHRHARVQHRQERYEQHHNQSAGQCACGPNCQCAANASGYAFSNVPQPNAFLPMPRTDTEAKSADTPSTAQAEPTPTPQPVKKEPQFVLQKFCNGRSCSYAWVQVP